MKKILFTLQRPFESKSQLLINGREKVWIKRSKNQKAIIHYSQRIDDVYESLEEYNPAMKRKVLIVFDDMIIDRKTNSHYTFLVVELF